MTEFRFKLRRGLQVEWEAINPVLLEGEPGIELDTNRMKVGDGVTAWVDLEYMTGGSGGGVVDAWAYVHTQVGVASVWTVQHNLDGRPNITTVDSGGTQVEGSVQYLDNDTVEITFSSAFSGFAYCS